ncbi:hypothetical protein GCM10027161_21250 [Microbispora hainanensis]
MAGPPARLICSRARLGTGAGAPDRRADRRVAGRGSRPGSPPRRVAARAASLAGGMRTDGAAIAAQRLIDRMAA